MSSGNSSRKQRLGAYVYRCFFIEGRKVDYREAVRLSGYADGTAREHINRWARVIEKTAGRTETMLKSMYKKEFPLSSKGCEQELTGGIERKK